MSKLINISNKKAQVWVETVIYTLIAFVLIGAVLAFVKPKIEELQDRTIIEQSLEMLETIDSEILSVVQGGAGGKRIVNIGLKKGELELNCSGDMLIFRIESGYLYSELDTQTNIGDIIALTESDGKYNKVSLTSNYSERYNITYRFKEELKTIQKATTPYKLIITNEGGQEGKKLNINLDVA